MLRRSGKWASVRGRTGSLLDVDHGSIPTHQLQQFVAGVWGGVGRADAQLSRVIGVSRRTRRASAAAAPTELNDGPTASANTSQGRPEYGTVTGRPRRTGWFDAVAVKHSAEFNGADELALMLLDG